MMKMAAAAATPPENEGWASPETHSIQLRWVMLEKDGTRWSRAVDVTSEWQLHVLPASTFLFKDDGAAEGRGGNLLERFVSAAHAYCTLGEIADVLREEFGEYEEGFQF